LETEAELLYVAEDALNDLPDGWELGIGEGSSAGIPYFYDTVNEKSSWKHPYEKKYIQGDSYWHPNRELS
jgi:hypothetical protein